MSYRDLFRCGRDDFAQEKLWINFHKPESMYKLEDVQSYDKSAQQDIQALETMIADLKEYRQDLANRYSALSVMTYTYKLSLTRERRYYRDNKVFYYVRLFKVLADGGEVLESEETFSGTERHKAIALFEQMKKERPGIETVKDIEKARWER